MRVDLLCGGFPCQDLSVAGRRAGLAGERSGLFFEFARVADALRPQWVLVENVPGLLSSNGGRDFGIVLGTLADVGYGLAWRILDSRYFGVPQRRRRVFVLGCLADGDPRAAAERAGQVLAVGQGCERHLAKGAEARPDASVSSLSGLGSGGPDDNDGQEGRLVTAPALVSHYGKGTDSDATDALLAGTVRSHMRPGSNSVDSVVAAPLSHGSNPNSNAAGRRREDDENLVYSGPLDGGNDEQASVRRLTPRECERLQGFPDDWTKLDDTTPDSRRYAALGDAVTVNVAEWIGRRIMAACSAGVEGAA